MKHIARLWENMLAKRALSVALCLALAVTSGGVCIASANNLVRETRAAGEKEGQPEGETEAETAGIQRETEHPSETARMEGEILEDDTKAEEEPEDTRCIHEFTAAWVGYECKLTDFVEGYEPGDEVRISVSFNKAVTSQIGLYIDGVWNSFRGEGKKRNITLVPDSDYLNIQISDMKGQAGVNLTEVSAEIVRKGEADNGNYLHKFTGLWQGFETKFSDYNPDYEPGDEIRVTVNYSKYVSSQFGMNIGGEWSTLTGEGKELVKEMTPDNDYLNIQITDMWANYKVGIISIGVDILKKGPGVSGYGGGGRLKATQYTAPGDYVLFSGDANEKYETNDGWLLDCADTDWITLKYSCVPDRENWGIMGWGATVDGQWVDGPGYSADSSDSTKEVTQTFSVKYLRRMMKITPESDVSYLNLGCYSDGRIEELTLHVGSEIPREASLFKDGAPNEPWICTDIERILDAPDDLYLCVQYKCATPDYEGWTVLSWGASVNGEWKNGKSYKVSNREATRTHVFSMRMDSFRNMLHLSWDAKVDSLQLSAYNDAQIMDIWFSEDKVEDPGDSKKDKLEKEGGYSSPNRPTYKDVANEEGFNYPQDISLGSWQWGDIEKIGEIRQKIKAGAYLVVEFETEEDIEPSLQFTMVDGKRQGVTPAYITEEQSGSSDQKKVKQAIFSYHDIQNFLPDYLIPEEIDYIQISSGDGSMRITNLRVVTNNKELEEEPIAVLTSSWSGFGTQISKWHSDYQVGDTVTVTATFDKRMPGAIAFNIGGVWNCGPYSEAVKISRTERPSDDYVGIQLGAMPETKRFAKIMDIKVEIAGKPNFNDYVQVTGNRSAGILASSKKEAATAVLSSEEINRGAKVDFVVDKGELSEAETEKVQALFGDQAEGIGFAKVSDITVYKVEGTRRTKVSETDEPVSFKIPVPDELKNKNYDFAVVREHNGELSCLEDLDGNPDTVTFASSRFSKFAVVYGEAGVFDGLSGAVKIFRGAWSTWNTDFTRFYGRYKPGKETKVTLTFDKDVRAFVDYNKPEWTRAEGSSTGRTFTTAIKPSDDSLGIGIADMNGNGVVKLMSVKVEQDAEKITEFTAIDQKYATSFSAYNEGFVKGYPITLKLTFDQEVTGGIRYYAMGTLDEVTDSKSTAGKVLTMEFTPGNDELSVWIADMKGNSAVKLLDVEVVQENVPPIYVFTHSWGGNGDTYSGKLSDLCAFEQGDKVKITAVFDKESQVKMMVTGSDKTVTGRRVDFTAKPGGDGFSIQAGDDSRLPLGLLEVTAEVVEKAPPVEGLHRFMAAWTGFETKFSEYDRAFEAGKETTVILTFDKEVKAQIGYNEAGGFTNAEGTEFSKTLTKTITPANDYLNIQIMDMNGYSEVNLLKVEVEQKEDPTPGKIHTFLNQKNENGGYDSYSLKLGEYLPDYKAGEDQVTVTVELSSDAGFNGILEGNAVNSEAASGYSWEKANEGNSFGSAESEGRQRAIFIWDVMPSGEDISVSIWWTADDSPGVDIDSIDVEKSSKPAPGKIHTFLNQKNEGNGYDSYSLELQEYLPDYQAGADPVTVTVELSSDAGFNGILEGNVVNSEAASGYSWEKANGGNPFGSAESEGKHTATFTWTVMPSGDAISVSIWWMADGSSGVDIDSIDVERSVDTFFLKDFILDDDPIHIFTEPETIFVDLADYYDNYESGQGVAVEMNLFSDGIFYAIVEDADLTEDFEIATASNARPVTEMLEKMAAAKASPSNATPSNAGEYDPEEADVYESDEEGVLNIQWEGNPQSGTIAVTILEMDGTQVNIDSLEVKEKAGAISEKNAFIEAARKMAAENFPNQAAGSEDEKLSLDQEPAKKEEELTEEETGGDSDTAEPDSPETPEAAKLPGESEDPAVSDNEPEEAAEKKGQEAEPEGNDIRIEQEAAYVNEPDDSKTDPEDNNSSGI